MNPGNIAEDSNHNPGFGYQYVAADIEAERSVGPFWQKRLINAPPISAVLAAILFARRFCVVCGATPLKPMRWHDDQ
jgi:hypothetical protein